MSLDRFSAMIDAGVYPGRAPDINDNGDVSRRESPAVAAYREERTEVSLRRYY